MIQSKIVNIVLYQSADFSYGFQINWPNSAPIDLSSMTIEGQLRHEYTSNTALNFVCNGYANGYLTIFMPASNTLTINAGAYVYDVMSQDSSNTYSRLVEGVITVTPAVTQFV